MARIVSTTTSGVPTDPTGGLTLDALMARQKELAERAGQIAAPRQMTSPWQGLAAVAQTFTNKLQEGRTENQLTAGRQQLAQAISGIDPNTGTVPPEALATAMRLDPDTGLKLLQTSIEARRAERERQQHLDDIQSGYAHEATTHARDVGEAQAATQAGYTHEAQVDTRELGQSQAATKASQGFTATQNDLNRQVELDKANAAAKAALVPKISDISGVRQDVISDPSYKNMAQAVPIWTSMKDAASRDTPQADLNMVIALAKLFDPTSVVRQSESGAVELTGNLPAQVVGQYKYLTADPTARLPPEVRQGMLDEAYSRVKGYSDAYGKTSDWFGNLAKESGIPVDKVVPTFGDAGPYVPAAGGDLTGMSDAEIDAEIARRKAAGEQ